MRTPESSKQTAASLRSLGRRNIVVARGNWSGTRFSADEVKVEFDATDGVPLNGG
ncbi:MAG: hypothetical protein QN189_01065 [Armatimonadota bacterium]|nr:hypothetical protein [Armatimonadota bacterium]